MTSPLDRLRSEVEELRSVHDGCALTSSGTILCLADRLLKAAEEWDWLRQIAVMNCEEEHKLARLSKFHELDCRWMRVEIRADRILSELAREGE